MEKFTVARTSSTSADVTNDIVLSETTTTRRIFRAKFVRRPAENKWLVEGCLICQRKNSKNTWQDIKDLKLSDLHAGEGVAVNLDSAQTAKLIDGLDNLKAIATEKGISWGKREMIVADPAHVIEVTDQNHKRIIEQLIQRQYGKEIWDMIADTQPDLATRLSHSCIHANRQLAVDDFANHLKIQDWAEREWEDFFGKHQWIFGYGLRYQFLGIERRQANYGGESYRGVGKQRGEFLARTSGYKSFTVVVEIKKPQTEIFSKHEYRNGVPTFSSEFIGGISQAQVNSRTWDTEGSKRDGDRELLEPRSIYTIAPLSILVVGSTQQLATSDKRRSFELFRHNLHNPEVLTFDELFERAKYIVESDIEVDGGSDEQDESFEALSDDDIPF